MKSMSSKSWCESGSTYTWCSVRSWLTFFSLGVRMDRSSFSGFKTTKALNMGISPSWISILSIHVILKIDCEIFVFSVNFLRRNFIIEWILNDMSFSSPISLCILVLVLLVLQWLFYSSWDFHNLFISESCSLLSWRQWHRVENHSRVSLLFAKGT